MANPYLEFNQQNKIYRSSTLAGPLTNNVCTLGPLIVYINIPIIPLSLTIPRGTSWGSLGVKDYAKGVPGGVKGHVWVVPRDQGGRQVSTGGHVGRLGGPRGPWGCQGGPRG